MRYTNGNDWVEIVGASKRPMRELFRVLRLTSHGEQHAAAVEMTTDGHFEDQAGNEVTDWRENHEGLSLAQWDWWQDRFVQTARDEIASPEA